MSPRDSVMCLLEDCGFLKLTDCTAPDAIRAFVVKGVGDKTEISTPDSYSLSNVEGQVVGRKAYAQKRVHLYDPFILICIGYRCETENGGVG